MATYTRKQLDLDGVNIFPYTHADAVQYLTNTIFGTIAANTSTNVKAILDELDNTYRRLDTNIIALYNSGGKSGFIYNSSASQTVFPAAPTANGSKYLQYISQSTAGVVSTGYYSINPGSDNTERILVGTSAGITTRNITSSISSSAGTTATNIPTEYAVSEAIKRGIALNDALQYKGTISGAAAVENLSVAASSGGGFNFPTNTANISKGSLFKVSAAGKINGVKVEVGDMLICNTDSITAATASNGATVAALWDVIQANIDGAVTFNGTTSGKSGKIVTYSSANGQTVGDGLSIASATSVTHLGWGTGDTDILDRSMIAYWNGAFSAPDTSNNDTKSNLRYLVGVDVGNVQAKPNNQVLATPATANGIATFRALAVADLPTLYWADVAVSGSSSTTTTPTVKKLTVTHVGDSNYSHIEMTRAAINYIAASHSSGTLAFIVGTNSMSSAGAQLQVNTTSVNPGTTNKIDLGTSAYNWRNLYIAGTSALKGAVTIGLSTATTTLTVYGSASTSTSMSVGSSLTVATTSALKGNVTLGKAATASAAGTNGTLIFNTETTANSTAYTTTLTAKRNNANYTQVLPAASGKLIVKDNNDNAVGGTGTPVYISGAGVATAINAVSVAKGGTGKTTWTKYSLPWVSDTDTIGELAIGTAGLVLTVNANANGYAWAKCELYTTVTIELLSTVLTKTSWVEVGSTPTTVGTYAVYVLDTYGNYSGVFSVSTTTNKLDEIPLHWASAAVDTADTNRLYLATSGGKFQAACGTNATDGATHTFTIKYKRLI